MTRPVWELVPRNTILSTGTCVWLFMTPDLAGGWHDIAAERHAGEPFHPRPRRREQHLGTGMVRIFGTKLQQAVREEEDDDALPGRV